MKKTLLIGMLGMAFSAQADIHKCQDANGRMVYQEKPCENARLKPVGTVKKPVSSSDEERARMMGIEQKNKADYSIAQEARKKEEKAEEEKIESARLRALDERKAEALERQATAAEKEAKKPPVQINIR